MAPRAGAEQVHVGRVGQQALVHLRRLVRRRLELHPQAVEIRELLRLQQVLRLHLAHLDGVDVGGAEGVELAGLAPDLLADLVARAQAAVGAGRLGRLMLVRPALLRPLEGGGEVEDLPAVLDRDHPPGGEAAAVAGAVDLVDHRDRGVAGMDEVGVQRVAGHALDRLVGRAQRLGDHVAAVDAHVVLVRLGHPAAEQVHLQTLDVEQVDQLLDQLRSGNGLGARLGHGVSSGGGGRGAGGRRRSSRAAGPGAGARRLLPAAARRHGCGAAGTPRADRTAGWRRPRDNASLRD